MRTTEYLKSFDDPEEALNRLQADHGVVVKRKDDKVLLNYGQFVAEHTAIANECRGLILSYPSFDVVSRSFCRFFNWGEKDAASIDWRTAHVLTKLDGSLAVVSFRGDRWEWQTRGSIDAKGCLPHLETSTFAERFATLVPDLETVFTNKSWCYVFEFTSIYNRIVTHYPEEQLWLLAVVDKEKGEVPTSLAREACARFKRPTSYSCNKMEDVVAMAKALPPTDEGYVVVDAAFHRIKVKNPAWLALAHSINAGGALTKKRLMELMYAGELKEVLTYYPELNEGVADLEKNLVQLKLDMEAAWNQHAGAATRKEFAVAVHKNPFQAYLFRRYGDASLTPSIWLTNQRTEVVITLIESLYG